MKSNLNITRILKNYKNSSLLILLTVFTLQSCGGGGGSTAPATPDTRPDAFSFRDINDAPLNSQVLSDSILIKGINAAARISIIGGEYSIDGGEFTVANGVINNDQKVQLRLTSFATFLTSKVATLTIGGVDGLFKVKTGSQGVDTNPTPFSFNVPVISNAQLNKDYFSSLVRITGINAAADISINGGGATYAITNTNGIEGAFTSASGKINSGEQVRVKLTSSNTVGGSVSTTLTIGSETADFSVVTLIPNDSTPDAFPISAVTNAPLSSPITSDPIVVRGISIPAVISIPVGGLYSINNGIFHRTVGETVIAGDIIKIQLMSSNTISTTSSITLTIGGVSEIFSVTTITGIVGITVSPLTLSLTESNINPAQDIVVRLNTPPNGDVVFDVASINGLAATVSPTPITLNNTNWNTGVKVTVTSHKDQVARGIGAQNSQTTDITFVVDINTTNTTDQTGYLLETVAPVSTTVIDDDNAKIVISPTQLGNINEGKFKTFAVKLNSEPLNSIRLSVSSSLPNQASIDTSPLVFTTTPGAADNWNNTQIITVAGIKDNQVDANALVNIKLNITSGDSTNGTQVGYNSRLNQSITATIVNTDALNTTIDGGAFLQFLNKSAPRNNETATTGSAYYAAIDPNNKRLTLTTFKSFNNLNAGVDSSGKPNVAVYVNDADLGFGRRMYLNVNKKTTGTVTRVTSVASCVENFAPAVGVNAPAQEKINLAKANNHAPGGGLIAIVCMEYSGTPGSPSTATSSSVLTGRKYVKFFTYAADGSRITQADLDGRGVKTQPGLCNTCHGGQGNSIVTNTNSSITYPLNGDTGAQFLPWDLDTFVYDNLINSSSTRVALEPILKRFNQGVLATYPQPQTFSFNGNVNISPAILGYDGVDPVSGIPVGQIDPATGKVVSPIPSVATSSITVSTANPLFITDFVLSIDADPQAGPGLTYSGGPTGSIDSVRLELVSPSGKRYGFRTTLTRGAVNIVVSGLKNLYWSDDAEFKYINLNLDGVPSVVNGILSGTILGDSNGFINNSECINNVAAPAPNNLVDMGCSDANGVWKLEVNNFYAGAGKIKAWSLHFNGVPDGAYLPAPVELIRGWYGGKNLPLAIFNGQFVPDGWKAVNNPGAAANPELLYLDVIGPTCRACHVQRGIMASNEIDFSTYKKFMAYADRTKRLVYDEGLMPIAKRTYENHFWNSTKPSILAQHMPGGVAASQQPGRNIANAGFKRTGTLAVAQNSIVTLNGSASLFPKAFKWTVTLNGATVPLIVTPVLDAQGQRVMDSRDTSIQLTQTGLYQVKLETNGTSAPSAITTSTTIIESSVNVVPVKFTIDVSNDDAVGNAGLGFKTALETCTSSRCHGGLSYSVVRRTGRLNYVQTNAYAPITAAQRRENYRLVRDRVNTYLPIDSMIIRKGLNLIRHGGLGRHESDPAGDNTIWLNGINATGPGKESYDMFLRWVLEGANFN